MIESIEITSEYGYTIAAAVLATLQYVIMGHWTQGYRGKVFTKKFIKENFGAQNKREKIRNPWLGYPDFGCGKYSEKLSYKDWVTFNSSLRVHGNTGEVIPIAVLAILAIGLFHPMMGTLIGLIWIIARYHYQYTYINNISGIEKSSFFSNAILVGSIGFSLYLIGKTVF